MTSPKHYQTPQRKTKNSMDRTRDQRYSREHSTRSTFYHYSSRDVGYHDPANHHSRGYYRAFEGSYSPHSRYRQISYGSPGSPSSVNPFFLGIIPTRPFANIINEPLRDKFKIPMYSPENEELWQYYRVKEGSLLRENENVLRKDVRAMEKALKNSLQTYERENRYYVLIKKQIDKLFTPKEIEELNLLAEKNIKDDLLSL